MNAPLIYGVPEPKLGDREKIERDNFEYNNDKQKVPLKTAFKGMYGSFTNDTPKKTEPQKPNSILEQQPVSEENKNPEKKVEKNPEQMLEVEKFKESPDYPILERFTKEIKGKSVGSLPIPELSNDNLLEISKILKEEHTETSMEWLKKNISKVKFTDKNTGIALNGYIDKVIDLNKDKEGKTNKNDVNAEEDSDSEKGADAGSGKELLELPEEFENNYFLSEKPETDDVVQLLIKNHTQLPDGNNGESNFDKDILTTFEVTANKVIDGKNFPRNESFNIAMKDVKNGDIETRFNALSYINTLVNTAEGLKGAGSIASYDKIKGEHDFKKQEYLDFKIGKLNDQLLDAKNQSNTTEITKLEKEITKLEEEKTSGDVFEAGEFDIGSEGAKEGSETKA